MKRKKDASNGSKEQEAGMFIDFCDDSMVVVFVLNEFEYEFNLSKDEALKLSDDIKRWAEGQLSFEFGNESGNDNEKEESSDSDRPVN